MSRVGKYMVYNPRKDKPVKYYDNISLALTDARILNDKEGSDILVLKVVANVETDIFKILDSEHQNKHSRRIEVIEDGRF